MSRASISWLALACVIAAAGCKKEEPAPTPVEPPSAPAPVAPPAPATASAAAAAEPAEPPTEEDFEEQAASNVSASNLDQALDALEKEIAAP
jgi:hypothetical protein